MTWPQPLPLAAMPPCPTPGAQSVVTVPPLDSHARNMALDAALTDMERTAGHVVEMLAREGGPALLER